MACPVFLRCIDDPLLATVNGSLAEYMQTKNPTHSSYWPATDARQQEITKDQIQHRIV
jgi:hypothetical protein